MRVMLLSAALLTTQIVSAAVPIDGPYATVFGGYAYLPDNVNKLYQGLRHTDATYRNGYNAGGSFGYKSNPMRYEVEVTYLSAQVEDFRLNGITQTQTQATGYSNAVAAFLNVFYDLPEVVASIEPYIGGGIGYAAVKAELNSDSQFGLTRFSATNTPFAYQGTLGLTYNFAENYALTLGYRYLGTINADNLGKRFQAHLANIGVVYRFNQGLYK